MFVNPPPTSSGQAELLQTPESWLPNEHSLYRPRHSRRQRTALTCGLVFFFVPVLLLVVGVRTEPFENRPLREFPGFGDGWSFFTGLSGWATDHLPLRKAAVNAADDISTGVFGDPPGAAAGAQDSSAGIPSKGRVPKGPQAYPQVIAGKDGWLYLGEDMHTRCEPVLDLDRVISALNRLRQAVEASGRRFELVFAPDKSSMKPAHLPDHYAGHDCAPPRTAEFWGKVPAATRAIDLRNPLADAERRLGRSVYDPHDTHWTFEAGLTMTYALAQAITPGVTATWQAKESGFRSWPADLERLLGRSVDRNLRAYALAPDGGADRTRYLASDFKTPLRLTQADTTRGTVKPNTAVVADSFSQFASPFLAATCKDLTIVHSDTVAGGDAGTLKDLFEDRDVVVFEFVERNVIGGSSALLRDQTIDQLAKVLAQTPR
ncbi:hypothetical protein NQK81_26225 [Amycolatopsis roodepoortensis]|uniref:alginate O-acetyltransferase AlgX-related protein n=1 Tax=Amycolatopsis roodepoortensis TaxID=700274 RepID=UPI00214AC426|nr:hypothetical protein [Amycolatopsis roodepoortensis]UUV28300.1 hypothetical protein NQK81_26225 [Amycolatopsis roodepoortensis]